MNKLKRVNKKIQKTVLGDYLDAVELNYLYALRKKLVGKADDGTV